MLQSIRMVSAGAGNLPAIAAMLAAMASFVTGDSIVKIVGRELPVGEIVFVRGLFASVLVLTVAHVAGALRQPRRAWSAALAWRTLAEAAAAILFFAGLVRLPFADINAIAQFTPLAITAGAALFFAEPVGWRRWLATLVGLAGVLMIIRPGSNAFDWAALLVVTSIVFVAARDLLTRRLDKAVPALLITAVSSVCVTLSGLVLLPFETWRMPSPQAALLLASAAVTMFGGYYWIILAMRSGEIAAVAPFRYAAVLFAVLSGILVFGEAPDTMTVLGILVVVAAGLYTLHRERARGAPARRSVRISNT